jgi:hypothetical protein
LARIDSPLGGARKPARPLSGFRAGGRTGAGEEVGDEHSQRLVPPLSEILQSCQKTAMEGTIITAPYTVAITQESCT